MVNALHVRTIRTPIQRGVQEEMGPFPSKVSGQFVYLGPAVPIQHHVLRLEVPVDRAFSMQKPHSVTDVQDDASAVIAGDRLRGVQKCLQASAHEQLHDEDKLVLVRSHGPVNVYRVGASEMEHHLQFPQEGPALTRPGPVVC